MARKLPPALMAKFFEGVEDTVNEDREWTAALDPRPSRLALGADPRSLSKRQDRTSAERKIAAMVSRAEDSSDSDHEGSRASIVSRK
jgi:hypothetical protein